MAVIALHCAPMWHMLPMPLQPGCGASRLQRAARLRAGPAHETDYMQVCASWKHL